MSHKLDRTYVCSNSTPNMVLCSFTKHYVNTRLSKCRNCGKEVGDRTGNYCSFECAYVIAKTSLEKKQKVSPHSSYEIIRIWDEELQTNKKHLNKNIDVEKLVGQLSEKQQELHEKNDELQQQFLQLYLSKKTIDDQIKEISETKKLSEGKIKELELKNEIILMQDKELEESRLKDEFIAMMSHELKTPLTAMTMWTDALKQSELLGSLNSDQTDAINEISSCTEHLTELINNFFDAYRLELGKITMSNDEIFVQDMMAKIHQIYVKRCQEKGVAFFNTTSEAIIMSNDEKRIHQVLANLINNALDFVPKDTGRIEINATKRDGDVIFYVKDNGIGITKEDQFSLFKKFYQVDTSYTRTHGGTGLGLAICKGLIDAMKGKIWLESEKGKGSTFFFSLPNKIDKKITN